MPNGTPQRRGCPSVQAIRPQVPPLPPRDVVSIAIDLIKFEKLPYVLDKEIMDRAFELKFVSMDYEMSKGFLRETNPPSSGC